MDNWRPDSWDALDIYASEEWIGMKQTDLVEAGADAIIEALKKQGKPIWNIDRKFQGYSVFIPAPGEIGDLDENCQIIPKETD